jgi:ArsR family transcriptional regulator
MNEKEIYRLHADFCKFMANPKRIEILFLLDNKEICVDELAEKMGINATNVSQHLSIMRQKGVVENRREGTKIYYKIANHKTLEACLIMRDVMIEQKKKDLNVINDLVNAK